MGKTVTSLFMTSAAVRVGIACVLLALLWLATWWAVTLP
ncbi:putative membrane protein [Raoultella ornithinolytica 2-156-04_S1_C2]|nr:putative membrane protein [Raoultella ornithinolytica 2-156-04_S1_C2]